MPDIKQLKIKIWSTKNIKKITGAMEVISTIRFQKVKKSAEDLREYMNTVLGIFSSVNTYVELFHQQHTKKSTRQLAILVSSEKGLCGSLNSLLFKKFDEEYVSQKDNTDVFVIGKKWIEYCRHRGYSVVGSLSLSDNFDTAALQDLYQFLDVVFRNGKYKEIKIRYNFFKNTMKQIPAWFQLFPLSAQGFDDFMDSLGIILSKNNTSSLKNSIELEPNQAAIVDQANQMIMDVVIYGAVLHNKTGEFAARMLAMKWAKDNAESIIDDLTLAYNKARQDAITQEVLEIVSAKAVLDG